MLGSRRGKGKLIDNYDCWGFTVIECWSFDGTMDL